MTMRFFKAGDVCVPRMQFCCTGKTVYMPTDICVVIEADEPTTINADFDHFHQQMTIMHRRDHAVRTVRNGKLTFIGAHVTSNGLVDETGRPVTWRYVRHRVAYFVKMQYAINAMAQQIHRPSIHI